MVYEVRWTQKAIISYVDNLNYLNKEWTEQEINNFMTAVQDKLIVLSQQPFIGALKKDKRGKHYVTIINKRISLLYRVKPIKKQIELILFWNTYRNPTGLKF